MAEIAAGRTDHLRRPPRDAVPGTGSEGRGCPEDPAGVGGNGADVGVSRRSPARVGPAPQATTQVGHRTSSRTFAWSSAWTARRCVNTVAWSEDASLLLSGSDDLCVCVWSVGTSFPCLEPCTRANHNIFSAEFVPGTRGGRCVTTAGDGDVRGVDLIRDPNPPAEATPDRSDGALSNPPLGFDDDAADDSPPGPSRAGRRTPTRSATSGHEGSIRPGRARRVTRDASGRPGPTVRPAPAPGHRRRRRGSQRPGRLQRPRLRSVLAAALRADATILCARLDVRHPRRPLDARPASREIAQRARTRGPHTRRGEVLPG